MKGKNTLALNQSTINEAVEFYLNSKVFSPGAQVVVADVTAKYGGAECVYHINVEPKPATGALFE